MNNLKYQKSPTYVIHCTSLYIFFESKYRSINVQADCKTRVDLTFYLRKIESVFANFDLRK